MRSMSYSRSSRAGTPSGGSRRREAAGAADGRGGEALDPARSRGDEVDVVLALQPVADDLQVQKAQEAAAEAEAQGGRGLHLGGAGGVVGGEAPGAGAAGTEG